MTHHHIAVSFDQREPLVTGAGHPVLRIAIDHRLNYPAMARVDLADDPQARPGAAYTYGTRLQVRVDGEPPLFDGTLTGIACKRRHGRDPVLTVTGHDTLAALDAGARVVAWEDRTVGDIVREIGAAHGFATQVDDVGSTTGVLVPYLLQQTSDLAFLRELGAAFDRDLDVASGVLRFLEAKPEAEPVAALSLANDVLKLQIDESLTRAWPRVDVLGRDPTSDRPLTALGLPRPASFRPGGADLAGVFYTDRTKTIRAPYAQTPELAHAIAHGSQAREGRAFARGRLVVAGNSALRPRSTITLADLPGGGQALLYVTRVTHRTSATGFRTMVQFQSATSGLLNTQP